MQVFSIVLVVVQVEVPSRLQKSLVRRYNLLLDYTYARNSMSTYTALNADTRRSVLITAVIAQTPLRLLSLAVSVRRARRRYLGTSAHATSASSFRLRCLTVTIPPFSPVELSLTMSTCGTIKKFRFGLGFSQKRAKSAGFGFSRTKSSDS